MICTEGFQSDRRRARYLSSNSTKDNSFVVLLAVVLLQRKRATVKIGNNLHRRINQVVVLSIINLQHPNDSMQLITPCGVLMPQVGQSSNKWISRGSRATQRRNFGYYVRDWVRDKTHVMLARPHTLEQCISNPPLANSKQRF